MKRDLRFRNCFKALVIMVFFGIGNLGFGQVPVPMSSQPGISYTENFADISNWTTNFASGTGANRWASYPITTGGTANDGVRTTKSSATFSISTSGGVQKGTGNLVFLSTGSTATSEAVAVDLLLDFTGVTAGTLSFDWAAIDNSNGTRPTSMRVFWSINNTTFTELTSAQVIDVVSSNSGSITNIALPASFNNSATARLRFYNHAGTVTGSTNRDKIAIDNVTVTGTIPITWTATGWSNTVGPDSTLDAVITAPYSTTANGTITAKKLTVSTGGSLTVNSGTNIYLTEGLVNSLTASDVVVENNANIVQSSGTTNTNSGNITIKRNSNSLMLLDNVMWGSPVTGQQLQAFSPATLPNRFYTYDSTTNLYVNETATNNFADAKGYLIRMPNTHPTTPTVWEGSFVGVPHSGDYSYTPAIGFNSVANPYPSTMSMAAFVADNATISGTLYFWRKTNSTVVLPGYCSWNSGTYVSNGQPGAISDAVGNDMLQVGQGFIVKATATTGVLFKNTQRTGNNDNQNYKTTNTTASADEKHRVWLNLTSTTGGFSQMAFGYMTNATNGVDSYDGESFNDGNVSLSSLISNQKFVIQGRALPFVNTDLVPLNFKVNAAGNYTIAIDNVDGLFANNGQAIYLRDALLNTEVNLSTTNYSFASAQGEFNNRFVVAFTPQTLGNSQFNANTVVIYKNNNNVVVNSGNEAMESVKVFDLTGRLLIDRNNINDTTATLSVDARNQVILVQVKDINGNTVSKKVIN